MREHVFGSAESAFAASWYTKDEEARFRVYRVADGGGRVLFVIERNPVVAAGRALETWGYKAKPWNGAKAVRSAEDLVAALGQLGEAERARALAAICGAGVKAS